MRALFFILSALILCACAGTQVDSPAEADGPAVAAGKRIALTYDDAPRGDGRVFTGAERTEALIEQWEATGPVAIFATTRDLEMESARDRLLSYAQAGHRIANHSNTHPWASRTEVADYLAGIDRAEALLDGLPNRRAWFRFPFLDEGGYGDADSATARRDALRAGLEARGLMNGYVTVDTYDWHLDRLLQDALKAGRTVDHAALGGVYADMVVEAAEFYDRMALDVLDRRPAQVLLLHENDIAALYTDEAVAALEAAGWTIIGPDEAYRDPIAGIMPETRFAGKGRIASIARDQGRAGADYFDHWSSSESGIVDKVEAAGAFRD